jgi:hypothetical protein
MVVVAVPDIISVALLLLEGLVGEQQHLLHRDMEIQHKAHQEHILDMEIVVVVEIIPLLAVVVEGLVDKEVLDLVDLDNHSQYFLDLFLIR